MNVRWVGVVGERKGSVVREGDTKLHATRDSCVQLQNLSHGAGIAHYILVQATERNTARLSIRQTHIYLLTSKPVQNQSDRVVVTQPARQTASTLINSAVAVPYLFIVSRVHRHTTFSTTGNFAAPAFIHSYPERVRETELQPAKQLWHSGVPTDSSNIVLIHIFYTSCCCLLPSKQNRWVMLFFYFSLPFCHFSVLLQFVKLWNFFFRIKFNIAVQYRYFDGNFSQVITWRNIF